MADPFSIVIPSNLTFQDYLAVKQTARVWADGYDLKSYRHLVSALAPEVMIDYTNVNPTWKPQTYKREAFAKLWLSSEHLGNSAMRTQHLLALPYFSYVGPRRTSDSGLQGDISSDDVCEIEVSWQTLASHGRYDRLVQSGGASSPAEKLDKVLISEASDHRAIVTHVYVKLASEYKETGVDAGLWKLCAITPKPIYETGDFEKIRRPARSSE